MKAMILQHKCCEACDLTICGHTDKTGKSDTQTWNYCPICKEELKTSYVVYSAEPVAGEANG